MKLSRRGLLVASAVPAAAVLLGVSLKRSVYRLKPSATCSGCKACVNHAAHKTFASLDAVTRAHLHCKCELVERKVGSLEYASMFASGAVHDDRRA